eukprot:TRINITY_DN8398_c0_g1_i2.p1 TRINITY_DN8398_c0_g1~~TRINITY_DN8398_c0_g1_i2.p1  ORF type:complete len:204 (-),score=31.54 TRINITY_DN8398_c0_g1_i2:292-903(-)
MQFIQHLLQGMEYLHQNNIAHRDLKTENIMIVKGVAKLTDFGLAKRIQQHSEYASEIKGTEKWFAPEHYQSCVKYQLKADVFAIGTVLWAMRTRQNPFESFLPAHIGMLLQHGKRLPLPRENPAHVESIVEMCWRQDPESRPVVSYLLKIYQDYQDGMNCEMDGAEWCQSKWGRDSDFEARWKGLVGFARSSECSPILLIDLF